MLHFEEININTDQCSIEFLPSDHYRVEIYYHYWKKVPDFSVKNGKLTFDSSDTKPEGYAPETAPKDYIRIYYPKGSVFKDIIINAAYTDISGKELSVDYFSLEDVYSSTLLEGLTIEEAKINQCYSSGIIRNSYIGVFDYNGSFDDIKLQQINPLTDGIVDGSEGVDTKKNNDFIIGKFNIVSSGGNFEAVELSCKSLFIEKTHQNLILKKIHAEDMKLTGLYSTVSIDSLEIKQMKIDNCYSDINLSLMKRRKEYNYDIDLSFSSIMLKGKTYEKSFDENNNSDSTVTAGITYGTMSMTYLK